LERNILDFFAVEIADVRMRIGAVMRISAKV